MIGAILSVLAWVIIIAGFVWVDRMAAAEQAREDAELREDIKHLPEEVQAQIWATHIRLRAEQDLH